MKLISANERAAQAKNKRSGRPTRIKLNRIAKIVNKVGYIHLVCGHITTPEFIELTRVWRPKKNKYYCEICGKWVKRKTIEKVVLISDEPMF